MVESRHDKVKQSIEQLVSSYIIDQPPLVDGPKSANMLVIKVYLVDERSSHIVVAQLSPEFTARLVDRWQELETGIAQNSTLPTNFNARDLHLFLESKQEFSHWIKNRINKFCFIQGTDFITIDNFIISPPSIDYFLTIDMAKDGATTGGENERTYHHRKNRSENVITGNRGDDGQTA